MENGKRIEFKGVAKIVILSIVILAITGITAIGILDGKTIPEIGPITKETVVEFEDQGYKVTISFPDGEGIRHNGSKSFVLMERCAAGPCDAVNVNLIDVRGKNVYTIIDILIDIKEISDKDWSLWRFHSSVSWPYYYPIDANKTTKKFQVQPVDPKYDYLVKQRIYKITVCEIEKEVHPLFDIYFTLVLADKTIPEIGPTIKEEKYTLNLEHYPPYYSPNDKEDPRRAGDLVATLTDKETEKPVSDKVIVFYVEKDEKDKGENLCKITREKILHQPYREPLSIISVTIPNIENIRHLLRFSENKFLRLRMTDSKGQARTNYIYSLDTELISKELRERGENGKIIGTIKAAALTQEDSENKEESSEDKKWQIECEKSVDIELLGIAKVTKVLVRSEDGKDKDKKGAILVEKANGETIPVYDKDYISKVKLSEIAKRTPYNLLSGDTILLNENDFIDVCWLTGTKMKITVKTGVLKEYELAKVHIGLDDIGWYEWVNQKTKSPIVHIVNIGSTGVAIAILKLRHLSVSDSILASFGAVKTVAFEFFALGWRASDPYLNPLIIEPYSTILIDFDENATVYTVEGTGRIHNIKDNSTTNVTTGHKISVSPDGTFSQVSEFDRSELNEDLSYLLESIEKDESENIVAPVLTPEHSELEISKLYVEKSVYPRKTEVDVQYHIKNIGTVDVDEYHVEYKINDFKGNEVYKFVGSTHSIASGEQQKFVAAENWKIPSDAKIGPYIINCTLIWDSKRDTAGREFFVTHPAKREDRTAELEISNLYTDKSEYLKGAGERVDVCYYVKNTGTVAISEYHVIYQIFDSEGKRYCWFISDMFGSIVAGKEDKWQSGGWKVPSDAKVGRYTVEAMVIWGLDRFSRETVYFFVK